MSLNLLSGVRHVVGEPSLFTDDVAANCYPESRSWVCCGLVGFLRIVFQRLQPAFDVRRATAAVVSDADPLAGSPDSSRCPEAWRPDTRAYRPAGETSADRDGNRPPMAHVPLQSPPCHRPGRGARRPVRCSLVVLEGGVPRRPVKSSRGHKPACADERRGRTERFDDRSPDSAGARRRRHSAALVPVGATAITPSGRPAANPRLRIAEATTHSIRVQTRADRV